MYHDDRRANVMDQMSGCEEGQISGYGDDAHLQDTNKGYTKMMKSVIAKAFISKTQEAGLNLREVPCMTGGSVKGSGKPPLTEISCNSTYFVVI